MSEDAKAVTVVLLDKEYLVSCREGERESLFNAAKFLNQKMRALRESGKASGGERVAVMAALNITHDYLEYSRRQEAFTAGVKACIGRVEEKVTAALAHGETVARERP